MIEHSNIFYVTDFNVIGGVEQYVYEVVKKYHHLDIGVIYKTADKKQIRRLKRFVPVYQYDGQEIKCDKLFCNYDSEFASHVEAKKKIQIIHAMYKTQGIIPVINKEIDEYIAVSKIAADEFKELTGIECKVARNPLTIAEDETQEILYLISATRLTSEKGKDRMEKLANELDKTGVKWLWLVFTNDTNAIRNKSIAYLPPRLDVRPYIKMIQGKGYGVQLSSCEGDCYFTRECEAFGIPLLVTPLPSFEEQGLVEGKNCYYIPFDVNISDKIEKIIHNVPVYKGYIGEDKYDELLVNTKSKYKEDDYMKVEVKCIFSFTDLEAKKERELNEIWECTRERGEHLEELGLVTIERTIKEVKKEKATPKTKKEKAIK